MKLPNPFLSLRPYTSQHKDRFFGRSADLTLIRSRLFSAKTTLLFAGSGVGKTSFLDALLVPTLQRDWRVATHRRWTGRPPLDGVRETLADEFKMAAWPEEQNLLPAIRTAVNASPESPVRFLLVLDQFEEVFQNWRDSVKLVEFARELAGLLQPLFPYLDARILFSMREEFLGELSLFDNLMPDLFSNAYRLKNLSGDQAEMVIESTVRWAGAECGPGIGGLLDDLMKIRAGTTGAALAPETELAEGSRIRPPMLQIVCYRLWESSMRDGVTQFLASYQPGSAQAELGDYCKDKLDRELDADEKNLASGAFGFLMTRRGAKMPYELDQLAEHMEKPREKLKTVLDKLSGDDVRILRKTPGAGEDSPWYELYHDMYAPFLIDWRTNFEKKRKEELQTHASRIADLLNALPRQQQKMMSRIVERLVGPQGGISSIQADSLAEQAGGDRKEFDRLIARLTSGEYPILRTSKGWIEPDNEIYGLPLAAWKKEYAQLRRQRWRTPAFALAAITLIAVPVIWYGARQFTQAKVLYSPQASFSEKRDAFALLRLSPWQGPSARQYWKRHWREMADESEQLGMMEQALLYRLEEIAADEKDSDEARRKAAVVAGGSWKLLEGTEYLTEQASRIAFRGNTLDITGTTATLNWDPPTGIAQPCTSEPCGGYAVQGPIWLPPEVPPKLLAPLAAAANWRYQDPNVRVTPEPRYVTVESDSYTQLWDATGSPHSGALLMPFPRLLAVSEDGSRVAATDREGSMVRVWKLARLLLDSTKPARVKASIVSIAESARASALVEPDSPQTIKVFRDNGESTLDAGFPILSSQMSRDGQFVAAAGEGGIVVLWDLGHRRSAKLTHNEPRPAMIGFNPDGSLLATRTLAACRVWRTVDGQLLADIRGCQDVVFDPKNRFLVTVDNTLAVTLRRLQPQGGTTEFYTRRPAGYGFTVFSPDGLWLVTAYLTNKIDVRIADTGRLVYEIDNGAPAWDLVFSEDRKRLMASGTTGKLQEYRFVGNAWERRLIATHRGLQPPRIAFSRDGTAVLAVDDMVHRYELGGDRKQQHLPLWGTAVSDYIPSDPSGMRGEAVARVGDRTFVERDVDLDLAKVKPIEPGRSGSWPNLLETWRKRLGMTRDSDGRYMPERLPASGSRGGAW